MDEVIVRRQHSPQQVLYHELKTMYQLKINYNHVCEYYDYVLIVAYLTRGDFNVFMVDWSPLTVYPCYLSSLRNTRLVSQCAAQLYAYLTYLGASTYHIHCVGHSLGAHICGMMSNHLSERQHKIIGEYGCHATLRELTSSNLM